MRSALSRTALVLAVAALLAPAAGGSSGVVRWRGLSDGEAEARKSGKPLNSIKLSDDHCVEVIGLLVPLIYALFIWWKGNLDLIDAGVLIAHLRGLPVLQTFIIFLI